MSRPVNPQSRRQRAIAAGISPSTLARWDKGAKPRKPAPTVSRCEPSDETCSLGRETVEEVQCSQN